MQAIILNESRELSLRLDYPRSPPGPDEVVVRLQTAALNRRDYWITEGMYPGLQLPAVLGSDGAGTVTDSGSETGQRWIGREVVINPGLSWGPDTTAQSADFHILGMPTDGTFATEVVVPVQQLHSRPAHLNWQESAALPLAGTTAWRTLFTQGRLKEGETVLITGVGGGVAAFALQFAVAAGANVWVTSSSDQKIKRAVELGAQGGVNYSVNDWDRTLKKEAGPPDLIIDGAGGPGLNTLIGIAAAGGRIVSYGSTRGAPEHLDLFRLFWKQIHLIGSTMGSPEDFASMMQFVADEQLRPEIDEVFPLTNGIAALQRMKQAPQFGKVVLEMTQDS